MKPWQAKTETTTTDLGENMPNNMAFQRARPANLTSDVAVPLAQALITGGLVAAAVGIGFGLKARECAALGLAAALIVWAIQAYNFNRLLWAAEKRWQIDINKDGKVGGPAAYPDIIVTNQVPGGGKFKDPRSQVPQLATGQHPFEKFVLACERIGTDSRLWEGQMKLPRSVYTDWRDRLMDHGYAMWDSFNSKGDPNKTQGWHLTMPASEILENCTYE